MTDPIADLLTRIRNANLRKLNHVSVPSTKIKENIVALLKDEGFVEDWKKKEEEGSFPELLIQLKYMKNGDSVIRKIRRDSKPGLRLHLKARAIKPILGGQGISIISTSKGVKTDKQCRQEKVGGELLCTVW